jgi:CrcB protein
MHKAGSRRETSPFDAPARRDGPWWARLRRVPWLTLLVIAAGGVLGALARQGLWAVSHRSGGFDWTTLGINVGGCALIGGLMTAITEVRHAYRLTGPFLAVGVLGGFTTFSTYIVEAQQAITAGAPATGLAYLAATLAAALGAVYAGASLTRLLARWHRREKS